MCSDPLSELSSSKCSVMGEVRLSKSSFEHTKMCLCQHVGQSSSENLEVAEVRSMYTEMYFDPLEELSSFRCLEEEAVHFTHIKMY
jgi:hypothetical protein